MENAEETMDFENAEQSNCEKHQPESSSNASDARGEDPLSKTKRINYYMFADAAFIDNVKQFVSSQQAKVALKYKDGWIDYLAKWCEWFDNYLKENKTDNLPPSWSSSEPLPIASIITEGDAGTGKTFSINTMMRTMPNGTVSSFARKGTDAYLEYAVPDTIPSGMNHVMQNNTICKMFNIKFSQAKIRARLEDIKNDKELEESYENLLRDVRGSVDKEHAELITRKHFQLAARKLWPLVTECYNELLTDFHRNGSSAFRRDVLDEAHPMYTGYKLVPRVLMPYVNSLVGALNEKTCAVKGVKTGMTKAEAEDRVRAAEQTIDQDTYRLNVMMGISSTNVRPPPAPALFPLLLFEEDGMAPSCFGDIRKILTFLSLMIYLPPYIMTTVPIIVSSGSTTQSSAIGSIASALEMCATPTHLADKENVLPYKSEFFRRDKNDFQANDTLACRATCMTLERCLPVSPYTYTSMYTHEEHSKLVEDPGYIPEGTRLYRKHDDVCKYTSKMASMGKADIPFTDIVFIADVIVPIDVEAGVHAVTREGLSSLSENEARSNRIRMWRDKQEIYAKYKTEAESDLGVDDFYSDDSGCNPTHEQCIANAHYEVMQKRMTEKTQSRKRELVVDAKEVLESCETGVVLPSDETFNETARNDILYDRVVNDRKQCRVIKTIRDKDGKTRVLDIGNDKDEKTDNLTFIVGRAVNLLSEKEHSVKRQNAEAIAAKLGNGTCLAQHYLSGSKVVDQVGQMTYDPYGDMVVEFARPNYDSDNFANSLRTTTNARILYMAFKRVRYMVRNAPATNEKTTTSVVFRGISCTLAELLENTVFSQHAPHAYKCMVYGGVIEKFQEWWISQLDPSLPMGMLDSVTLKNTYKILHGGIPTDAREIFDEYDRLVNDVLTSERDNAEKRKMAVDQLATKFERLVIAICSRVGKAFATDVKLDVYVDRSPLYSLLKYEDKPVQISNLRLNGIGDIKVVDSGRSACNAVWRQNKEREYTENMKQGARYPSSLLRREKATSNGRYPVKPAMALWMGVEAFQHELHMDSMCTLLLLDNLLVTTHPQCSAEVNWSTIFTEPKRNKNNTFWRNSKSDTFGLMLRRGMAEMSAPSRQTVNTMFVLNGGELMNLPRPFRPQSCNVFSDVILKTRNLVISSAKKPRSTVARELSVEELDTMNEEDLKIKRFEMAVMFGVMNPVYGTPASTVAYAQGSTHRGYVFLNFQKIGRSDQLVGMTRTSDATKLKVAAVMNAADEEREKPAVNEQRERRRKRIGCMSQHYYFRQ